MHIITLDATASSMKFLYEDTLSRQDKLIRKLMAQEEFQGVDLAEVELPHLDYSVEQAPGPSAMLNALRGLPMKSLTAVAPLNLHLQTEKPECKVNLLFGEYHRDKPTAKWASELDVNMEVVPNFGRELYSDDKIIQKVSLNLLQGLLKNTLSFKKLPLVS